MDPRDAELLKLDILIAEKLMGWTVYRYRPETGRKSYEEWLARFRAKDATALHLGNEDVKMYRYSERLTNGDEDEDLQGEEWSPSRSIADAMEVVRKLRSEGYHGDVRWEAGPLYKASFRTGDGKVDVEDMEETPELAIARAAAQLRP